MGKTDVIMRDYLSDRTRFADFFNGVFFQGTPVIKAADLLELRNNTLLTKESIFPHGYGI